jgi:hypothetical protein
VFYLYHPAEEDQQVKPIRNNQACSLKSLLPWKSNKYTHTECVLEASIIQHSVSVHPVLLSCVVSLVLPYFSTLCNKGHGLRKIVTEHAMCVLTFSTTVFRNICHSKSN